MDSLLKVSIIVPTLNEAQVLSETLTQIQQLCPHELVVSDGRSDDNTFKIAENLYRKILKSA